MNHRIHIVNQSASSTAANIEIKLDADFLNAFAVRDPASAGDFPAKRIDINDSDIVFEALDFGRSTYIAFSLRCVRMRVDSASACRCNRTHLWSSP